MAGAQNQEAGLSLTNFEKKKKKQGKSPRLLGLQTSCQLNKHKGICPTYFQGCFMKQMKGCETL